MFRMFNRYVQKLKIVGPRRFIRAVYCRMQSRICIAVVRKKILFGMHETISKTLDFGDSWRPRTIDFLQKIADGCDREKVIAIADEYVAKRFDLLGSGKQSFGHMPWHEDFRLSFQDKNADCLFDAQEFYADIQIQNGTNEKCSKDIKLPWELSRFHHLSVLAKAYNFTGDVRYADAAKEQVIDWLDHNPYLHGINWACPMEVAIRATNWIVAWQWLQETFRSDETFYQRIIGSLYDHMRYLENNWEFYDGRTSNHYLSNLIGYLYLCYFFDDLQKFNWCYKEILREFDWQIFDEGSSYEGSTRYHQLVMELLLHGFLLAQSEGKTIVPYHLEKINRMIQFVQWCKPSKEGEMVSIGDDDSGSLLHKEIFPISQLASCFSEKQIVCGVKQYEKFGLSIIKTNEWHVTVRHHAYINRQPSGHFHNDAASITLAYKGIPILVDPGSYLYTPSVYWRNRFRSVKMHNTVCIDGCEPILLDNRLFALGLPQGTANYHDQCEGNSSLMSTQHSLYAGIDVKREIEVQASRCCITDSVRSTSQLDKKKQIMSNFVFASDIVLQQHENSFILFYKQKPILNIVFLDKVTIQCCKTWLSCNYGKMVQTKGLQVVWQSGCDKNQVIFYSHKLYQSILG